MADNCRKSRSKTRRRSKSVASEVDGDSNSLQLKHSVTYSEKAETVKKKKKKQLQKENIILDAAKQMLEVKLNKSERQLHIIELKYNHLKDQLHKRDEEVGKLTEDGSILKKELERTKDVIFQLSTENVALKENLKKSEQDLRRQRTEFDAKSSEMIEQQANERKENQEFVRHFSKLLEDSRVNVYVTGSSENFQVGGLNIVKEESKTDEKDIKSQWKELTDKLCLTIEEQMNKRNELEMKARNDEVLQNEVKQCVNKILSNKTSKGLGKDKELLEFLTSDRSDQRVLTDGIKQLKKHFSSSKTLANLPLAAEVAVSRLLNKFDKLSCKEFVGVLEGKQVHSNVLNENETKSKENFSVDTFMPFDESEKTKTISRRSCLEILSKWLTLSEENDEDQLLNMIKVYESKLSTEMVWKYQQEIKHKKTSKDMQLQKEYRVEECETSQGSLPRTPNLQESTEVSQLLHQLGQSNIVFEIDEIPGALKVQDSEK